MRFGVHLPQYGRAAGAGSVRRAAVQAEELGLDDVWVSDHLVVPVGVPYPPAFLFEPVVTLTWAAAATTRIGLGTSVLVLPYRHPIHLAKELASLDVLSGGRLVVGAAAGWLAGEFEALGVPFAERGDRTDEAIDVMRACWEQKPVELAGQRLRVEPRPDRHIPIWVGGHSPRARRRALERGDGWHGTLRPNEDVLSVAQEVVAARPTPAFTVSLRTPWDGLSTDADDIRRGLDDFAAIGVDHVVAAPVQGDVDDWLRSVEALAELVAPWRS